MRGRRSNDAKGAPTGAPSGTTRGRRGQATPPPAPAPMRYAPDAQLSPSPSDPSSYPDASAAEWADPDRERWRQREWLPARGGPRHPFGGDLIHPTGIYDAQTGRQHLRVVTDNHHCGACGTAINWLNRKRVQFMLSADYQPFLVQTARYFCGPCADRYGELYQSGQITVPLAVTGWRW